MALTEAGRMARALWEQRPWPDLSLREAVLLTAMRLAETDPAAATPTRVTTAALRRRGVRVATIPAAWWQDLGALVDDPRLVTLGVGTP